MMDNQSPDMVIERLQAENDALRQEVELLREVVLRAELIVKTFLGCDYVNGYEPDMSVLDGLQAALKAHAGYLKNNTLTPPTNP